MVWDVIVMVMDAKDSFQTSFLKERFMIELYISLFVFFMVFQSIAYAQEAYLTSISKEIDFDRISVASQDGEGIERETKFLAPAKAGVALDFTVYQDVNRHPLHYDFLVQELPAYFSGLTQGEFYQITNFRQTRQYYAGVLYKLRVRGEIFYGFNVFLSEEDDAELLRQDEVKALFETLKKSFSAGKLVYVPKTRKQIRQAQQWQNPGFEIYFLEIASDYIPYSQGVNYGFVKVYSDMDDFYDDVAKLSWQDLVVIPEAPPDIETVIAGAITGELQGALSHLSLRLARRGFPDAYVKDAVAAFQGHDGKLIRLEVEKESYTVKVLDRTKPGDIAEAQAWWDSHRPDLSQSLDDPDLVYFKFGNLLELSPAVPRFGGKASNLAQLYQLKLPNGNSLLEEKHRTNGFAIPLGWYEKFMEENKREGKTLAQFIIDLEMNERFKTDSEYRFEQLDDLRDFIRDDSKIPLPLAGLLGERIEEVFGSKEVMVRFRSSSNAEDNLLFNGAGLYDSASVCAADSFDDDARGPSLCNPDEDGEKTIEDGLKKVWKSLWNYRAYEEREYYRIPHLKSKMGVLVTQAFPSEDSNGVIFTGNPLDPLDKRYFITFQKGDESVVSPTSLPEKNALVLDNGVVKEIKRLQRSSIVGPGEQVLSDDQLKEMGSIMALIDRVYPVDIGEYPRAQVLLDMEAKYQNGIFVIKQIRPFLISLPDYRLRIPEGGASYGRFSLSRNLREELALKSKITFKPGVYRLLRDRDSFALDVIESVEIGLQREKAEKKGPGVVSVEKNPFDSSSAYIYTQDFLFQGKPFQIRFEIVYGFTDREIVFDEAFLSNKENHYLKGMLQDGQQRKIVEYIGNTLSQYPMHHLHFTAGEDSADLYYRADYTCGGPIALEVTYPADLVGARIFLNREERIVDDYWHLVYSALKHNEEQKFMVLFEKPVGDVYGLEVQQPGEFCSQGITFVRLLDQNLQKIRELLPDPLRTFNRLAPEFERGDANQDNRLDLSDAVFILNGLFTGGKQLSCMDAGDVNDDGKIDLSDAVYLLQRLFLGGQLIPEPADQKGVDPTMDGLGCEI